MYPSRFRYEAPRSLDEAISPLRDGGDYAKVLAGGQSLVPMMKLRFASPELVVDINNVPGLDYHRAEPDGTLRIGALCRHAELERSGLLKTTQPTMAVGRPADRRPHRPQPRHPGRLAVPRRPAGRLGLGGAGARRLGGRAGAARHAHHPARRLRHRAVPERPGPGRDRGRGRDPRGAGRQVRRLPQAGTPGRRLRHGRGRGGPGDQRREGDQGGHRADRGRRLHHRRHRGGRRP